MNAPLFQKVLIANRGEIARRIIKTCRALGIQTVAVCSEADREALHVLEADESVLLGPAEATSSYLDVDRLMEACSETGADALHPGYGFLSENPTLATRCAAQGVTFVGPPAAVLEASGDKLVVKRRMAAGGVPTIPGPLDLVEDDPKRLLEAARNTGFPLLVKAVAGGGGKGMRLVDDESELLEAAASARREAAGAFGNAGMYIERVIEPARHVEVQVLCDNHGAVVVLGERDCSLQRRHQKVIEECPAPALSAEVRRALHEAGADAARAIGYRGAGTVEFLMAPSGAFWFMELNRRLQVEHPVTEMCYGVDIVAWQMRIAAGRSLPPQSTFTPRGHAIEARIYAEDPSQEFMPSVGDLLLVEHPSGPGIRVDSAIATGMSVSPHYDPMLAKIIAHGETREEAIARLDLALRDTAIVGVRHNIVFLRTLLSQSIFHQAEMHIDTVDNHVEALTALGDPTDIVLLAAVAHELLPRRGRTSGRKADAASTGGLVPPVFEETTGFRLGTAGESA